MTAASTTNVLVMTPQSTSKIRTLHTLGPRGTNCEAAAREWFTRNNVDAGEVVLYSTLEQAVKSMPVENSHALLGCVVYPELHTLVFSNLKKLVLGECFVFPTFNMLFARRPGTTELRTVACHPAPQNLVPSGPRIILVNSNAQAALDCANGVVDACITTLPAARAAGLEIISDHGPVSMGFTIHMHRERSTNAALQGEACAT
ncbi:prephenate dehydratase [Variovorax boronicumulans]|uniref:hypothetical protein n=2 Tax=Variovorax boronicumulans TaxID=436515 RepID=UPI0027889DF8|nr:hypothetical protein [Variovorax boronicumulans]MDQ0007570.1 prephenate dehydratase [Variovorax boronicumulans]